MALDVARRALLLDPLSEPAARTAMRARALAGDRAGALACFEELAARLGEMGAAPDAETRALAERVRRERTWRLPRPAGDPERGEVPRRAPLVGRAAELERLLNVWAECRRDRHPIVSVVEGDVGTGKTRLAEEVVARARLDGAATAAIPV